MEYGNRVKILMKLCVAGTTSILFYGVVVKITRMGIMDHQFSLIFLSKRYVIALAYTMLYWQTMHTDT